MTQYNSPSKLRKATSATLLSAALIAAGGAVTALPASAAAPVAIATDTATGAALKSFSASVPKISGTAKVGQTLRVIRGAWKPSLITFTYTWYRNGSAIFGSNWTSYKVKATDVGKTLRVKVTARKPGYRTVSYLSHVTATVQRGTLATGTVKVNGTRKVGRTLTASTAKWTSGATFHYRWYRNGSLVSGATKKTYKLGTSDRRKTLSVKVWTTKSGYNTSSARTSARTAKIAG